MSSENYLFVTGRLAEPTLRRMLPDLSECFDFQYNVAVMPISVAALMSTSWLAERLEVPEKTTRILLPGHCRGDCEILESRTGRRVERGPGDLHDLPRYFREKSCPAAVGEDYRLRLAAVIKQASQYSRPLIHQQADALMHDGADVVVLSHEDREPWPAAKGIIQSLVEAGHRVWIRSLDPAVQQAAVTAGAKYVEPFRLEIGDLWKRRKTVAVVTPDLPGTWDGVDEKIQWLRRHEVPWILQVCLTPIGMGFAPGIFQLFEAAAKWEDAELSMDLCPLLIHSRADSAPMLLLMLGLAEELGYRFVLTTQSVNTARTSVRECDWIRRLTFAARRYGISIRNLDYQLAMLRDPQPADNREFIDELATRLSDPSPRVFVSGRELRVLGFGQDIRGDDAYDVFEQLLAAATAAKRSVDARTAFYLGYEMAKAGIAGLLGKNYSQDEALHWGMHTVREPSPAERRQRRLARKKAVQACEET